MKKIESENPLIESTGKRRVDEDYFTQVVLTNYVSTLRASTDSSACLWCKWVFYLVSICRSAHVVCGYDLIALKCAPNRNEIVTGTHWSSQAFWPQAANVIGFQLTAFLSPITDIRLQLNEQLRCLDIRVESQISLIQELQEFYRRRGEVELDYSKSLEKLAKNLQLRHKEQKQKWAPRNFKEPSNN